MDKKKREKIVKDLSTEVVRQISQLEKSQGEIKASHDAGIAREQEKIDILKIKLEAFKKLK